MSQYEEQSECTSKFDVNVLDNRIEIILKEMESTLLSYIKDLDVILQTLIKYDEFKFKKELYKKLQKNPKNFDIFEEFQSHIADAERILSKELNIQLCESKKLTSLINLSIQYSESHKTKLQTFFFIYESLTCKETFNHFIAASSERLYNLKQFHIVKQQM